MQHFVFVFRISAFSPYLPPTSLLSLVIYLLSYFLSHRLLACLPFFHGLPSSSVSLCDGLFSGTALCKPFSWIQKHLKLSHKLGCQTAKTGLERPVFFLFFFCFFPSFVISLFSGDHSLTLPPSRSRRRALAGLVRRGDCQDSAEVHQRNQAELLSEEKSWSWPREGGESGPRSVRLGVMGKIRIGEP